MYNHWLPKVKWRPLLSGTGDAMVLKFGVGRSGPERLPGLTADKNPQSCEVGCLLKGDANRFPVV